MPGVVFQRRLGGCADLRDGQAQALGIDAEEVLGQRQDVGGAFAQRRQLQAPLVQVVVQACVELAGGHRLGQVDAGGGHQAHIDRYRLLAADALHLAGLQRGQQLFLQDQRQVGDLVQVEGAGVGRAEPAGATAGGAGIGRGDVTEQLGLTPARADRGAADGDEQAAALALAVDMPGQQLLAGAGLADDQHRQVGAGQRVGLLAQLARTRIDEHQRLGANAQRAFLGIAEGQQGLLGKLGAAHCRFSGRGEPPPGNGSDGNGRDTAHSRGGQRAHARRRSSCSICRCRRYR